MFIDLKSRIKEKEIQELIIYSVFPDPKKIEMTINQYIMDESHHLYGIEVEDEVIGIIGFITDSENHLEIKHIAVKPVYRSTGYGRGLILEVITLMNPDIIIAETDEEAVEFYRNIGFIIRSLGERFPGIERFQCTYET